MSPINAEFKSSENNLNLTLIIFFQMIVALQ